MSEKNVLFVSRTFWPHMSDSTQRILGLGAELATLGQPSCVLTTRPNKSWPRTIAIGSMKVHRVEGSYWNPLRASRYCKSLSQWIEKHSENLSTVYFDEVGIEAAHYLSQARSKRLTSIARFNIYDWTSTPDRWQPPSTTLDALRKVDLIHVPNSVSARILAALGIVDTPIRKVSEWYPTDVDRSIGARREARQSLVAINQDLLMASTERLIVLPGECNEQWAVDWFLRACLPVLENNPRIRLWILGEGQVRNKAYERIRHHGLSRVAVLPGVFTELESILQAADLCVFPGRGIGYGSLIPSCVANDIPVLLTRAAVTKELLVDDESPAIVSHSHEEWNTRLQDWIDNPDRYETATMQLKQALIRRGNREPSPALTMNPKLPA